MTAEPLPDHVARNRAYWDETNAPIEIQAPEGTGSGAYDLVDPAWARKWPAAEIWRARNR